MMLLISRRWRRFKYGSTRMKQRRYFGRDSSARSVRSLLSVGIFTFVALRPNRRTRDEVRSRVATWLADNPSWPLGDSRCIAMHIRHGDKLTPLWQESKHQDRGFVQSFEDYVDAALRATRNLTRIMYMTDDKDIVDEAPQVEAAKNVTLFTVRPGRPLVSTRQIAKDKKAGHINHQIQCRKDIQARQIRMIDLKNELRGFSPAKLRQHRAKKLFDSLNVEMDQAKAAPKSCAHDYSRDPYTGKLVGADELLQWLATWELMSYCDTFVAYSLADSFFTELIYVWISVLRYKRGGRPPRLVLLEKTKKDSNATRRRR